MLSDESVVSRARLRLGFFVAAVIWAIPAISHGQIFETNEIAGTVGEYDASGAPINFALISGLYNPTAIAVSGSDLFVASSYLGSGPVEEYTFSNGTAVPTMLVNSGPGSAFLSVSGMAISGSDLFAAGDTTNIQGTTSGLVREYTTSGAVVNSSVLTLGDNISAIAVSGSNLFVSSHTASEYAVGEYTTNGTPVNASLVTSSYQMDGIAISGSDMFVSFDSGEIAEYTTSGSLVATLATGLGLSDEIALDGSNVFFTDYGGDGTIGELTPPAGHGGWSVNTSLVSGLDGSYGIAIKVPEPASISLLAIGSLGLLRRRDRMRE